MIERVLSSRRVFGGRVISVRVDEVEAADGHRGEREVVEHPGAVGVVVVHEGDLVLVRQYRHPTGEVLLEIPAGKLDVGGEGAEACALREAAEETGLRPGRVELWASFYTTPGFSDEIFHLFRAYECEPEPQALEPGEVLAIERVPLPRVRALLESGDARDAKTLVALGLLLARTT